MKKSTELLGEIKKQSGKGWRDLGELTGFGTYWSEAFYYDRLPNIERAVILLDTLKVNADLRQKYLNTLYGDSVAQILEKKGLFLKNLTADIDEFITLLQKWTQNPTDVRRYIMSTWQALTGTQFAKYTKGLLTSQHGGDMFGLNQRPWRERKRAGPKRERGDFLKDSACLQD